MVSGEMLDRLHETNGWKAVRCALVMTNGRGEHGAVGDRQYVRLLQEKSGKGEIAILYKFRVPSTSVLYAGDMC